MKRIALILLLGAAISMGLAPRTSAQEIPTVPQPETWQEWGVQTYEEWASMINELRKVLMTNAPYCSPQMAAWTPIMCPPDDNNPATTYPGVRYIIYLNLLTFIPPVEPVWKGGCIYLPYLSWFTYPGYCN